MRFINRDHKWPSTKRRRAAQRNKVISQVVAVTVGVNCVAFSLALLVPAGQWLALGLLVGGTALTTAVVNDILNG